MRRVEVPFIGHEAGDEKALIDSKERLGLG
jgi:hypothetical protein